MSTADYGLLNNPNISMNSFYPRPNWTNTPQGAEDHTITVEDSVQLSCRFFPVSHASESERLTQRGDAYEAGQASEPSQLSSSGNQNPTILFFYGNGETAVDYDGIAPLYNRIGVNFFVADYRGYGRSGGTPEFNSMLADAHRVLGGLTGILKDGGYTGEIFVMGRSMGRHAAFEIAARSAGGAHGIAVKGMIIESGRPNLGQFVNGLEESAARDLEADYQAKVASISIPSLIIHGELDTLAPLQHAVNMYESLASSNKRMLTIPRAGHNDLMYVGIKEYFTAIKDFVDPDVA